MKLSSFLAFMLLFAIPSFVYAGGIGSEKGVVIEQSGSAINWGSGLISSSSELLPMQDTIDPLRTKALAVRQSGVIARKTLLDTILYLHLDSKETVSDFIKDDIKTSTSLRGLVQNSLLSTQDTADGMVKVTASLNIRGELSSVIIPATLPFLSGIPPTLSESRSDSQDNGDQTELISGSSYSGIVIDARGLNLTPVLLPVIYDGMGVGVYGSFLVSRDSVIKNGLVFYAVDTPFSNLRERIGNVPLVVKPVSTHGTVRGNVILSLADAFKVRAALKRKSITENCSVVIMMDAPKLEENVQNNDIPGAVDAGTVQGEKVSSDNNADLLEDSIVDDNASSALQQ